MRRKLRFGMIGGGRGAFIGGVHRIAAAMDGRAELVAGAFSSDPARSRASGSDFFLDPSRVYGSYKEMAKAESAMPPGRRLDFVVIVTPNHQHFGPARLFLESGFNVVCDKPVTFDLAEAKKLRAIVRKSGKVFVLTHNYTSNAMVKQARELVRNGTLGKIRKVVVEYPQGWLADAIERTGQKQASWRTDPKRSGAAGCMGDIGTHAENLARYITGLEIDELCADLSTFVKGRKLDDDGNVLVRYKGGARPPRVADPRRRRERPEHPRLRDPGVARVAPGAPQRARREVPGQAPPGLAQGQRLRRGRGQALHAHPRGPSRRLP